LAQKTLTDQVKGLLKKLLAGQRPTLRDVARELRLSTRTLQRRLAAERAKFQHLVEDARRELAQHYLLHSSLELNETAIFSATKMRTRFFARFTNGRARHPVNGGPCMPIAPAPNTRRLRLRNSEVGGWGFQFVTYAGLATSNASNDSL